MEQEQKTASYRLVEESQTVRKGMERYGGSFVKALSVCILRADLNNLRKIKATWPNYWAQYLRMGASVEREE